MDPLAAHYALGLERGRLPEEHLELVRALELLERYLPPPPADVLDVSGTPGVYASRLARRAAAGLAVEAGPAPLGLSAHLLVVARAA